MSRIIGRGRYGRETYPEAPRPILAAPGRIKSLQNGVPLPLLQVDISQIQPPDRTFAARLQFAAECTDSTDAQIRQGDCNSAAAYKAPNFTTSQAQTTTNAFTAGNLTTTFSWTTSGTVATLNVTVTTTLAVPTDFKFHYNVVFATHTQFTFL